MSTVRKNAAVLRFLIKRIPPSKTQTDCRPAAVGTNFADGKPYPAEGRFYLFAALLNNAGDEQYAFLMHKLCHVRRQTDNNVRDNIGTDDVVCRRRKL